VQLSLKYETVLNMTTAKALGPDVPTSILLSADELIEREYRNARRLDRRRQQWVKSGKAQNGQMLSDRWQSQTCQSIVSHSTFRAWRLSRSTRQLGPP